MPTTEHTSLFLRLELTEGDSADEKMAEDLRDQLIQLIENKAAETW